MARCRVTSPGRRRGYALPLVMLLALVGGIIVTMIVEGQSTQLLAEKRQVETHLAHHEQQGLAEVIEMWLRFGGLPGARTAAAAAAREGPADDRPVGFTIRGPGGEYYRVEMESAQGLLLDQTGVPTDSEDQTGVILARAAEIIRSITPNHQQFLRARGPGQVDVNTAGREVLIALARAADPTISAEEFAEAVVLQRLERRIDAAGIRKLIGDAGVTEQPVIERIAGLFVFESTLRRVEVAMRDPTRRLIARHRGLLLGDLRSGSSHPWTFLTWQRDLEADTGQDLDAPRR